MFIIHLISLGCYLFTLLLNLPDSSPLFPQERSILFYIAFFLLIFSSSRRSLLVLNIARKAVNCVTGKNEMPLTAFEKWIGTLSLLFLVNFILFLSELTHINSFHSILYKEGAFWFLIAIEWSFILFFREISLKKISRWIVFGLIFSLLFLILFYCFAIMFKANLTIGDDAGLLVYLRGKIFSPEIHERFDILCHQEFIFLLFTPFFDNPKAYFLLSLCYFLIGFIIFFKGLWSVNKKSKLLPFFTLLFLLLIPQTLAIHARLIYSEHITLIWNGLFVLAFLRFIKQEKMSNLILVFIPVLLSTYTKESNFFSFLTMASVLFFFKSNKDSKDKLFITLLLFNGVSFLLLYKIIAFNGGTHYGGFSLVSAWKSFYSINHKTYGLANIFLFIALYRVYSLLKGRRGLIYYDTLFLGGVSYFIFYPLMSVLGKGEHILSSPYYFIPSLSFILIALYKYCCDITIQRKQPERLGIYCLIFFLSLYIPKNLLTNLAFFRHELKLRNNDMRLIDSLTEYHEETDQPIIYYDYSDKNNHWLAEWHRGVIDSFLSFNLFRKGIKEDLSLTTLKEPKESDFRRKGVWLVSQVYLSPEGDKVLDKLRDKGFKLIKEFSQEGNSMFYVLKLE